MEQLLLHLVGDYVSQIDWMARNKTKATWPALCHALVYSFPFLLIGSPRAVLAICAGHLTIDRFRLARYVVWIKHRFPPGHVRWGECSPSTGAPKDTPDWLATLILIAVDNTIHLVWNYAALRWL